MFRIAVDVQLFQTLDKPKSSDVDEIAKATGVSSELLGKQSCFSAIIRIRSSDGCSFVQQESCGI